ncbi:MAG: helix-turn-helix domain-containing protein [Chloroflexota bacterium]|nr:helix-turn-helix domain-containing protein [Chloroflexota bacterium]
MSAQPIPIRFTEDHTTTLPSMTLVTWTTAQLAEFRAGIVADVAAEALAANWLPRRPMTPDELAEFLHVSRETIRRWTVAGDIEAWQHGHTILYLPDAVAVFLNRGVS